MILKKLVYGLAMVGMFAFASCDSENEPKTRENDLSKEISNDFYNRCPDGKIEKVATYKDLYHYFYTQEAYVYAIDVTGNKCIVAYADSAWSRTIRSITDIAQLPYDVRKKLSTECPKAMVDGFSEIKEVAQKGIANKYYILHYLQDTQLAANCEHTLVIDSAGMVLKTATYSLNNIDYTYLYPKDIDWIAEHYDGAKILGYVNDLGYDNYIVMDNGVLKSIYFGSTETEVRWKATKYALPDGEEIPSKVVDTLNTDYPGFTYTEVSVVETPLGKYYSFIDGTKPERPGYNIWL